LGCFCSFGGIVGVGQYPRRNSHRAAGIVFGRFGGGKTPGKGKGRKDREKGRKRLI
jgi:hypothetical protein